MTALNEHRVPNSPLLQVAAYSLPTISVPAPAFLGVLCV